MNNSPKMTREHLKYIANIIATLDCGPSVFNERLNIATHFAAKLAHCSKNFKYNLFIEACKAPQSELLSDLSAKRKKSDARSAKHLQSGRC